MKLSVIVPILNEAGQLPDLLAHLQPLQQAGCDILLVDGGSDDGSRELVRQAGYRWVNSQRGRARQMNAGAALAKGEGLIFLHADTRLPEQAMILVQQALGHSPWGRFDVRILGRPYLLRVISWMMNCRSRLTGIATGDQALFVRRSVFEQVGGFPDQALMEDVALCQRLKAMARPVCVKAYVTTSGRRWETHGVWRTIWLMWRLRWLYWRGTDVAQLARLYP